MDSCLRMSYPSYDMYVMQRRGSNQTRGITRTRTGTIIVRIESNTRFYRTSCDNNLYEQNVY